MRRLAWTNPIYAIALLCSAGLCFAIFLVACQSEGDKRESQEISREEPVAAVPDEDSSAVAPLEEERRLSAENTDLLLEEEPVEEIAEEGSRLEPVEAEEEVEELSSLQEPSLPSEPASSAHREEASSALPAQTEADPPPRESVQPQAQRAEQAVNTLGLDEQAVEESLLRLINADREEMGRQSLGMQEEMRLAARIRAAEVIGSLSHTRPDGSAYNTAFDEAGFAYAGKFHGENILYLQAPKDRFDNQSLAQRIFDELSSSSGHYQNMTQENFVQAGMGIHIRYDGDNIQVGCTQLFAGL